MLYSTFSFFAGFSGPLNCEADNSGAWFKQRATGSQASGLHWYSYSGKGLLELLSWKLQYGLLQIQIIKNWPWSISRGVAGWNFLYVSFLFLFLSHGTLVCILFRLFLAESSHLLPHFYLRALLGRKWIFLTALWWSFNLAWSHMLFAITIRLIRASV